MWGSEDPSTWPETGETPDERAIRLMRYADEKFKGQRTRRVLGYLGYKFFVVTLAYLFVFMSLLLVMPYVASKVQASDHLVGLTYSDYLGLAALLTIVLYMGFSVFSIATGERGINERN